ncbi:ribosome rescue GTPase HflX [Pseudoalteromonas fenneropenaei]|uniref:GTPase HflX n=1 Tax=Pseudoalteromonas fenneropenaei TaxID=1737459 RepID=A0ABV7CL17_9GAMM
MFDRYEAGEQAILVHINFSHESDREDLHELEMLVSSAGVNSLAVVQGSRQTPHAKFFVGTGKAEEIAEIVKIHNADVVIFNHQLSPSQERNLERVCQCRVLDRTSLILDIFAQRARTHEGKLQVELAQLKHISTRLIRGWTHLERQKGGIGLRGPGETQLETDRRLLKARLKTIMKRLEKVALVREQGRRARSRNDVPTVSLVGYTNAGKSSLFNRITNADVYAADQLFATLDPTLRKVELQDAGAVILADTVGFIRHLPHDLVAAFKATLTETREADLQLHVVDAADPRIVGNMKEVQSVLKEIEANHVPQLLVYNKIDLLADTEPMIERDDNGAPIRVWLSAQTGAGVELLFQAMTELLSKKVLAATLCIPANLGKLRGSLFTLNSVQQESYDEQGNWLIDVRMPMVDWEKLKKEHRHNLDDLIVQA